MLNLKYLDSTILEADASQIFSLYSLCSLYDWMQ